MYDRSKNRADQLNQSRFDRKTKVVGQDWFGKVSNGEFPKNIFKVLNQSTDDHSQWFSDLVL